MRSGMMCVLGRLSLFNLLIISICFEFQSEDYLLTFVGEEHSLLWYIEEQT